MEMNQEWIEQYNKRCAEFLGWKNKGMINLELWVSTEYQYGITTNELKFHSHWNCIMEIVEIIEELDVVASFTIEQPTIYIWKSSEESNFKDIEIDINTSSKKEAVVKAIDQFLIWNEQQNK